MAKKSMINREKRRAKLAKKYADKRAELKAVIADPEVGFEEGGSVRPAETASRFEPVTPAQPLRPVRSSARFLPQVRPGAQPVAGSRHARRRAGPAQGQLVTPGRRRPVPTD